MAAASSASVGGSLRSAVPAALVQPSTAASSLRRAASPSRLARVVAARVSVELEVVVGRAEASPAAAAAEEAATAAAAEAAASATTDRGGMARREKLGGSDLGTEEQTGCPSHEPLEARGRERRGRGSGVAVAAVGVFGKVLLLLLLSCGRRFAVSSRDIFSCHRRSHCERGKKGAPVSLSRKKKGNAETKKRKAVYEREDEKTSSLIIFFRSLVHLPNLNFRKRRKNMPPPKPLASQADFAEAVSTNVEDFDMSRAEAVVAALEELKLQVRKRGLVFDQ